MQRFFSVFYILLYGFGSHAQPVKALFKQIKLEETNVTYYDLLVSNKGELLATTSFIFCTFKGSEINFFWMEKDKKYGIKNEKTYSLKQRRIR